MFMRFGLGWQKHVQKQVQERLWEYIVGRKGEFYVYNTTDQWYRTGYPCYFLRWKRRRPPFCSDSLISLVGLFELYRVLGIEKKISSCSWLSDSCLLLWDLMV